MRLRTRMALLVTLLVAGISAFIFLFFPARMQKRILANVETEAKNVSHMTSFAVAPALIFGDRQAGRESLRGAAELSDISYAVVDDAAGHTFAAIHPERALAAPRNAAVAPSDPRADVYRVVEPVFDGGRQIGTLRLGISLSGMHAEIASMRQMIALVSLLIFVTGMAATVAISAFLTRPLAEMVETAKEIARGDRKRRAPSTSRDETGHLARSFNAMLDRLDKAHQDLEELNQSLERRVTDRTAALEAEISERRRGEAALQSANERFTLAAAAVSGAVYDWDIEHGTIVWTDGLTRVLGYSLDEVLPTLEWWTARIHPEDAERVQTQLEEDVQAGRDFAMNYRFRASDNKYVEVLDRGRVLRDEQNRVVRMVGVMENVTELKRLEDELRQSQKMDAIGRLAGGVAHDFNNLLTTILGYSHLLLGRDGADPVERPDLLEIQKAAERAASLTQQLLAFSRRQVIELKVHNLNAIVGNMENMLRRLIGEDILLETRLDPALTAVKADRGQLEQIVMNIAVNARDAMERGGRLTIRTANVVLDDAFVREHRGAHPGLYSMLAFADTGKGMDEATKAHVFEPFFTTKTGSKGTGLGMATVYGIVKHAGGFVWIDSAPDRGTTVTVYLPQTQETAAADTLKEPPPPRGTETVLVVEDEDGVRTLVRGILRANGYRVIEACDGPTALVKLGENLPIDLLLTDVVMPGMSGRELADQVLAQKPGTTLLYMSGYTEDTVVHHGVRTASTAFLQKPFTPDTLLKKVRESLDAARDRKKPPVAGETKDSDR